MLEIEKDLTLKGFRYIAGVDEAGRGPLAGPVVSASVIFPSNIKPFVPADSKKLSKREREELYYQIKESALSVGIGVVDNTVIDKINILNATKLAMKRAVRDLKMKIEVLISDYVNLEEYYCFALKKADEISHTVAASSIVAKVYRDKIMEEFAKIYPHSFDKHKGYPTKQHIEELKKYGVSPIHRKSFRLSF
ncbi:MAG: ribonuclease HII [Aquificae bacterium]|nr:ribonuclease HII [Aquificota bacterium]